MARNVKDVTKDVAKDVARGVTGVTGTARGLVDGRSSRWDDHREARREALVEAAVAAIGEHGPGVSIAQVATSAGVSKPVLYRYFADKDDLYRAVGAWGGQQVIEAVVPALFTDEPVRRRVDAACAAYLAFLDSHPQLFLLLVEHRSSDDPLADGREAVAAAIARVLGGAMRKLGLDAAGAEPWAHGLVGIGLSTGEWWLRRRTMSRAAVARYLGDFVWHAFEGMAREHGVTFGSDGQLHIVPGEAG